MWENVPFHMCAQRRLKSACASAQSDQPSLSAWRTLHPLLSKMHPVKIMIRGINAPADRSETSLGAHIRRYVFWRCCLNILIQQIRVSFIGAHHDKMSFRRVRTAEAQVSLRIWSGPSLSANRNNGFCRIHRWIEKFLIRIGWLVKWASLLKHDTRSLFQHAASIQPDVPVNLRPNLMATFFYPALFNNQFYSERQLK